MAAKEAKVDPLLPLAAISDDENDFNDFAKEGWEGKKGYFVEESFKFVVCNVVASQFHCSKFRLR